MIFLVMAHPIVFDVYNPCVVSRGLTVSHCIWGGHYATLHSAPLRFVKKQTNKQKNNSHPGLEKSSFGPVPGPEPAPEDCPKPQTSGFGCSGTHPQRSSIVSKSQPETQAVEGKTQFFRFCLCVWGCVFACVYLQGHAPSLMTMLSRAVSQYDVRPLWASKTI